MLIIDAFVFPGVQTQDRLCRASPNCIAGGFVAIHLGLRPLFAQNAGIPGEPDEKHFNIPGNTALRG